MQSFVEEIIQRLVQANVEFLIVGGVSAVLNGAPVVTQDLDVCYRRKAANIERLAGALIPLHPRLRGIPPGLPDAVDEHVLRLGTNFTLDIGGESLDLLGEMSAIGGYEQVIANAEALEVAGYQVNVLSLEHLIMTKRAAGRAKDLAVLPLLEATLQMSRQR